MNHDKYLVIPFLFCFYTNKKNWWNCVLNCLNNVNLCRINMTVNSFILLHRWFPDFIKTASHFSFLLSLQRTSFCHIFFLKNPLFSVYVMSLILNFIFQQFFLATTNHIEFFRVYIGKFMFQLCCRVNWIKKMLCFEKFKKVFCAFTKTGLENLNHFAYNFPANSFIFVDHQMHTVGM